MMYRIVFTRQAKRDLRNIYEYIAYALKSEHNASSQIRKIENAINGLQYFPERFKMLEMKSEKANRFRIMPVRNYNVYYIVNNDSKTVAIIRIIYKKRNIENELLAHLDVQ